MKLTILVIDDEPQIRRLLKVALESQDYHVQQADSGQAGLAAMALNQPDVVILDLGLPDISGLEVLRQLRQWSQVPVIILSVQDQEPDKIAALDGGADDYLTKPFGTGELLARIRLAQRHRQTPDTSETSLFVSGPLQVDLSTRTVTVNAQPIKLTKTEYKLLTVLIRHAGKVLTQRYLLTEVWGAEYAEEVHYLQVYMAQLRRKLESDSDPARLFVTESGVGYRLVH